MPVQNARLERVARPSGVPGVYLVSLTTIDLDALPLLINGRPVMALAPHPDDDDQVYVTTEHPDALEFVDSAMIDLR